MPTPQPPLTSRQRAHLRALAHHEKAAAHVGKDGVTEAAAKAIEQAFNNTEILKVKVLDNAPATAADAGAELAQRIAGVRLVQVMGRTVTLYRRHPENPKIDLPK